MEILAQTFRDVWAHKLRSALTMFGIGWGVASLMMLLSYGQGFGLSLIGADVQKQIFSGRPAVDKEVKIAGIRFTVVGVLEKKTQISNYSAPDDATAIIPFSTLSTMLNTRYLNNIVVLPDCFPPSAPPGWIPRRPSETNRVCHPALNLQAEGGTPTRTLKTWRNWSGLV
jgi:hypothetical protein